MADQAEQIRELEKAQIRNEVRFDYLEKENHDLKTEVKDLKTEMKAMKDEILDAISKTQEYLNKQKGIWQTLLYIGSAIVGASAVLKFIYDLFKP